MKKIVSLMLAVMLAFALCIPAAARAMYCGHCGAKLTKTTTEKFLRYKTCEVDSTKKDSVYLITTTLECESCDGGSVSTSHSQRVECDHYLTQEIEFGK